MMGSQLIEVGRQRGLRKFVAIGTICAYSSCSDSPSKEDDMWAGLSGGDQCAVRPGEENDARPIAGLPAAVRIQFNRAISGEFVRTRDNFDLETSHVIPALIRKCAEAQTKEHRRLSYGETEPH